MRKFIKLFTEFFNKNILKSLALLLVITSTGIMICLFFAHCSYYFQPVKYFQKIGSKSDGINIYGDYMVKACMDSEMEVSDINAKYDELVKQDVYAQISKLPSVEKIYTYTSLWNMSYNNNNTDVFISNNDTYKVFNYPLSDGCWFSDSGQSSKYPDAVVCGALFENISVGNDIEILDYNKNVYKIHVIGKISAPYMTMTNIGGIYTDAVEFKNKIFCLDNKITNTAFENCSYQKNGATVKYKDSATDKDIEECHDFYRSFLDALVISEDIDYQPSIISYEENMQLLWQTVNNYINTNGIRIMAFILAATFMCVALTVLMIKKKMKEYYIYYFCGCSKRKTFLLSFSATASTAILSGLICSMFMWIWSYKITHGMTSMSNSQYVFDSNCYLMVWLYLLTVVLISCIIPFIMLVRKNSTLMKLYRKDN